MAVQSRRPISTGITFFGGVEFGRHVTGFLLGAVIHLRLAYEVMTIPSTSGFPPTAGRLNARTTVKPINFLCLAPQAKAVFLSGDFNQWDPTNLPMTRQVDGSWQIAVPLRHGSHLYQFLVDGVPTNDPRAQGIARNELGARVSMIMVS